MLKGLEEEVCTSLADGQIVGVQERAYTRRSGTRVGIDIPGIRSFYILRVSTVVFRQKGV